MLRNGPSIVVTGLVTALYCAQTAADTPAQLKFTQRSRVAAKDGIFEVVTRSTAWDPKRTAIVVCDMWDTHHCLNAVLRVQELAPRMNQVLEKARDLGVFIIHAPSSCMEPYKDHPARKRAQAAPQASNVPKDIGQWCHRIPAEEKGPYPLDQSDGGCDTAAAPQKAFYAKLKAMGRNPDAPWKSQIDVLKIHDEDAISDSGVEIWNLMEERGIKNVILVGVHTNMCVLGRPFGLRQMAKNGKNVVLMRDMTDTMYNPARWPYVSHFHGTDLIIEHIEKFVCPTVTSDQVLGGRPFKFKGDVRPNVVIAIAESEYDTKTTLPRLAKHLLEEKLGLNVTILQGSPSEHVIPGFADALAKADLLILSIRRVALPEEDMAALRKYLDAGRPLVAIRTSSHAFDAKGKHPVGHVEWTKFDGEVLGGNYHNHYPAGPLTTIRVAPGAEKNPLLSGIKTPFTSKGSLYLTSPLDATTTTLLSGFTEKHEPEQLAWTNTYKKSRVFYTSLGHADDFKNPSFVQLMENAVRWTLHMPIASTDKLAGPYRTGLQDQIRAKRELSRLLKRVTDDDSMQAARRELPGLAGIFNEVFRWAIILPYPPAGANERLRSEFGPQLEGTLAELQREMQRIRRLPGGSDFLNELQAIPWLQDPITPWQVLGPAPPPLQAGR
jgi:nicotinamidase-related amidase/type 1 glutamine amidotransferase